MVSVLTPPIPLASPAVGGAELAEVEAVLASGWLTQGPRVAQFEQLVAEVAGVRHAVATTSATTALHLVLAALRIGPGDEVLVPDFTFPATANVVTQTGATPVLVDVDLATFTIDPDDLERRIGPRSVAVIPVHAFGVAADMDAVNDIAGRHSLVVVEDAACAIGATYRGRPCGSLGRASAFSFHPRKIITTGEGGMVTTDDDRLADELRLLRSHGSRRVGRRLTFEAAGFNYRMSDIAAGIGVAQVRRLDGLIAERRRLAGTFASLLASIPGVRLPVIPEGRGHAYQSYVVLLDEGIDRDGVIEAMASRGIETTIGTYALHAQPAFGQRSGVLPVSWRAFRQTLALPLYPGLSEGDAERIAVALAEAVAG